MAFLPERIWDGRTRGSRIVRALLVPASLVFGGAVATRNALYRWGVAGVQRADVPVVSVGNLRVGGTGKTPLVIWLVEQLQARGARVVVVARGYRAGREPAILCCERDAANVPQDLAIHQVVIGRDRTATDHREISDEALLVAMRTGVPVVTFADRLAACSIATRCFAPDVIVLDDGFQHRRLARDVDIVLLDSADHAARRLPAGPLRERPSAVGRADVVVLSGTSSGTPRIERRAVGLVRAALSSAEVEPLTALEGVAVTAVSGIARNDGFLSMLRDAGARVRAVVEFPDHHRYRAADWDAICRAATGSRIVTTEKDLVKLSRFAPADGRLTALRIALHVEGADAILHAVCARARLDASRCGQHDRPHPRRIEA